MSIRKSMALLAIFCLAGCVPSLHQLYTADTLVYDPAIEGTWLQDEERWKFVGNPDDKSYTLTITESEGKQSKLIVHLIETDGKRFFDFYPSDDAEIEAGDWIKFHLVPAHLFFSVEKKDDRLVVAAMNPDEITKMVKKRPDWVKHEIIKEERLVLTDTPKNLQKFLLEGLTVENFFGEPTELTRIQE